MRSSPDRFRAPREVGAPSVYCAGKFVRRHRIGIASVAAVILALTAGIGIAVRQAHLAEDRFNDVRTLANRFLFDFHGAIADIEGTTKARAERLLAALRSGAQLR